MPFSGPQGYPISNKDVVSFTFDDPTYDIDRPVFIDARDPSVYYTHRTAKDLVTRLIAGFHAVGLEKDDTVCVHSFNSLVYPLLNLAVIGAGGRSVGTNPTYTKRELNHAVKIAKVKFVFSEPEIFANLQESLETNEIDVSSRLWILDTQPDQKVPSGLKSWRALLEYGHRDWRRFDDENLSTNEIAQLFYTSGTTGLPKCAMTTHRNLVAQHQLFFGANPRSYPFRIALCLPFFQIGIAPQILVSVLREGRSAYVMRRFELEPFLLYHAKYQLTEAFTVPPMVIAIVMSGLSDPKSPNYQSKYSLRSLLNGTVGAAPLSADIQARFAALLGPDATFSQIWGMTETTTVAALMPWDIARSCAQGNFPQGWGSVGKPLSNITMKLVDEQGKDVSSTTRRGELCVKGPTVVKGYFDNEAATKASWDEEGYLKTGDVVELDKDTGLIYIVERIKELIKVRGLQVAPAELEGALTEHPDIVDAAVIGVESSDGRGNESPFAFVVVRSGKSLNERDVHEHMKERLAEYKRLTGGVRFVDTIPKLPSGKILKRLLRERVKEEGKVKL